MTKYTTILCQNIDIYFYSLLYIIYTIIFYYNICTFTPRINNYNNLFDIIFHLKKINIIRRHEKISSFVYIFACDEETI